MTLIDPLKSTGSTEPHKALDPGLAEVELSRLYTTRFSAQERESKSRLWQVLCTDFFQRYVRPQDTVLDVGAGYCEFINHIQCSTKIALDLNEDILNYAGREVRVVLSASDNMRDITADSVDVAFVSNFFEHMPTKQIFLATLKEIQRVLKSGGRLLILQPNIRFLNGEYWDFLDHHIPLTDRTLVEAVQSVGLKPVEVRPKFLPYTTKSRFPQHPLLIKLYLRLPLAHQLLGKQAWVVAVKA
jgi:ubiquinone/menaquinone biosynthesis C-methylase UbiE